MSHSIPESPCSAAGDILPADQSFIVFACLDKDDNILWLQLNGEGLTDNMPEETRRITCLTVQAIDDETIWTISPEQTE